MFQSLVLSSQANDQNGFVTIVEAVVHLSYSSMCRYRWALHHEPTHYEDDLTCERIDCLLSGLHSLFGTESRFHQDDQLPYAKK